MADNSSRRPLKVRSTEWARVLAATLSQSGITPNRISALSVVAAALGGAAFVAAGRGSIDWTAGWIAGALGIQARLICNLMDGMVAVEGGRQIMKITVIFIAAGTGITLVRRLLHLAAKLKETATP